jgi:aerobic-type carbon monoxide dehydrogenase small subunit (CoxS/CutS family)
MNETIEFRLNGKAVKAEVDSSRFLLWVLRSDLGLTSAKYGCGMGHCGACTVLMGKRAVRSCRIPMKDVAGKEVTTVEGLIHSGQLHPLQKSFVEKDALQCGYCTPGMIMNAYSLLLNNPRPSRVQILQHMEGNLCRCGAHGRIVAAIQAAAEEMGGNQR